MIDWLSLGFLLLPKIIKMFIHSLWAHACAKEHMLYGEFLQLAAFIQTGSILWTGSILISDDRMSKWYFIEKFIIYFMEYKMIIRFCHILFIWHSIWPCFKTKCTPVHEMMSCMVAFMERYMCCHFKVWTVHVISTSIDRGKIKLMHIFPKISLIILLKKGIRRLVGLLSISIDDEHHYVEFRKLGFVFKL